MKKELSEIILSLLRKVDAIKIFQIISITTLTIIIMPEKIASTFWLSKLDDTAQTIIGIIFILSFVISIVLYIPTIRLKNNSRKIKKEKILFLKTQMQDIENIMLVRHFFNKQTGQFMEKVFIPTGECKYICELESVGIIKSLSYSSDEFGKYKYSLDRDVLNFLNHNYRSNKLKIENEVIKFPFYYQIKRQK